MSQPTPYHDHQRDEAAEQDMIASAALLTGWWMFLTTLAIAFGIWLGWRAGRSEAEREFRKQMTEHIGRDRW